MRKPLPLILCILLCFCLSPAWGQLEFIENQGQWPVNYGLRAKLNHGDFWLSGNKAAFVLSDFGQHKKSAKSHHHGDPENARNHAYTMEFLGASASSLQGQKQKEQYHNYFLGKDQKNWHSRVSLFSEAFHKDLYPGIDLLWKEENGNLKYEFLVAPGSRPQSIRMAYKGLDRMQLKNGNLILTTSLGTITEKKPVAWQTEKGRKIPVACAFVLETSGKVGFRFPSGYDPAKPLVIDPVLVFSSFSGARSDNWGFSATYGENGSAYAAGIVLGTKFPVTTGAFSQSYRGDSIGFNIYSTFDIGILKFSSSGNQLLFATFLGGTEAEAPSSLVVDKDNNLVVFGVTGSSNFPVTAGCYDPTYNGGQPVSPYGPGEAIVQFRTGSDIIVSKFSPDGTQLVGSTFLGGTSNDGLLTLIQLGNSPLARNYGDCFRGEVGLDSAGNILIASHTQSTNFPTAQPIQQAKAAGFDGICARFNPSLTQLQFSSFIGGNGDDGAFSLQVAEQGRVYLSGGTSSSNFPTTTGTFKTSFSGVVDGFVYSFVPGQGLASVRSTYVGTPQYDQSYFVQRDKKGNVYLFGQTTGNYPVSANVYSNPSSGQFIHCLSPNLDSSRFSTTFGSGTQTTNIAPTAFLVDDCGRIYCSGWGGNTNNILGYQNGFTQNMPTTQGAYRQNTDGSDFYVLVLEKNAQALSFATYFGNPYDTIPFGGGDHVDGGTSRFDKRGIVYQSVCAGCGSESTFPTTPGVVSNTNNSNNCNNALFKYDFSLLKARYQPSVIQGCAPLEVHFNSQSVYANSYRWDFQDGPPVSSVVDTIRHTFDSSGTYQVKLVAINPEACPATDSITRTIVVQRVPNFSGDSISFCSRNDTLALPSLPDGNFSWSWSPTTYLNTSNERQVTVRAPQESTVYTGRVETTFGCHREARFKVSNGILEARAKADTLKGCMPLNLNFSSKSYQAKRIRWFFGDGDSSEILDPSAIQPHTFSNSGNYTVVIRAENDTTCLKSDLDTLVVQVFSLPVFSDTLNRYCEDGSFTLKPAGNRGAKFAWSPSVLLNDSTLANPSVLSAAAGVFSLQITDTNQCGASGKVELRDGRLKAKLEITSPGPCTPVNLTLNNQSLNAQRSRYIWAGDSAEVIGTPSLPLTATDAGVIRVKLRVYSDTACRAFDETMAEITLGGIRPIEPSRQAFCPGDSVLISGIKKPGYHYQWPVFAVPQKDSSKAKILGYDSVAVTIGLADSFGCPGVRQIQMYPVKPRADFTKTSLFEPCLDYLNYELVANPIPGGSYSWKVDTLGPFTGGTLPYRFPVRGNYSIRLIATQNNCPDTLFKTVEINDPKLVLSADFDLEAVLLGCEELPKLIIHNHSVGADKYIWSWQGNFSFEKEPIIPIREEQNLKLNLTTYNGLCTREASKEIELKPIIPPNLITRNGDGKNDFLRIENLPPNSKLEIRDRWGKQIFHSDNYQNDWKPPSNLETGFYELTLPGGNQCKTWIQVVD